jgi:hypothetical protein
VCQGFNERAIAATHSPICLNDDGPGGHHLKSWLAETSADEETWPEVAHKKGNEQLNGRLRTGTLAVAGRGECRFIGW